MASVLKTDVPERVSGVRIPRSPPLFDWSFGFAQDFACRLSLPSVSPYGAPGAVTGLRRRTGCNWFLPNWSEIVCIASHRTVPCAAPTQHSLAGVQDNKSTRVADVNCVEDCCRQQTLRIEC